MYTPLNQYLVKSFSARNTSLIFGHLVIFITFPLYKKGSPVSHIPQVFFFFPNLSFDCGLIIFFFPNLDLGYHHTGTWKYSWSPADDPWSPVPVEETNLCDTMLPPPCTTNKQEILLPHEKGVAKYSSSSFKMSLSIPLVFKVDQTHFSNDRCTTIIYTCQQVNKQVHPRDGRLLHKRSKSGNQVAKYTHTKRVVQKTLNINRWKSHN